MQDLHVEEKVIVKPVPKGRFDVYNYRSKIRQNALLWKCFAVFFHKNALFLSFNLSFAV